MDPGGSSKGLVRLRIVKHELFETGRPLFCWVQPEFPWTDNLKQRTGVGKAGAHDALTQRALFGRFRNPRGMACCSILLSGVAVGAGACRLLRLLDPPRHRGLMVDLPRAFEKVFTPGTPVALSLAYNLFEALAHTARPWYETFVYR